MTFPRPRAALALTFAVWLASACASTDEAQKKTAPEDDQPVEVVREELGPADDEGVLEETKKSAAEQLECPIEEVRVMCKTKDADGMCTAVRAWGCDKELEYSFGE